MSSTRVPKIEDFLKKEISQIISSQVKDPRYQFLNIVDVKCSSDLGVAKVFYTIINGDISDAPNNKSLEKFASMIRSKLSKFMQIRSCLLYTSPSPRDRQKSRMPSSA